MLVCAPVFASVRLHMSVRHVGTGNHGITTGDGEMRLTHGYCSFFIECVIVFTSFAIFRPLVPLTFQRNEGLATWDYHRRGMN